MSIDKVAYFLDLPEKFKIHLRGYGTALNKVFPVGGILAFFKRAAIIDNEPAVIPCHSIDKLRALNAEKILSHYHYIWVK